MRGSVGRLAAIAPVLLLASCVRLIPEGTSTTTAPPPPANALAAGISAGPSIASLKLGGADARGALAAFKASCSRLVSRSDASGLTAGADWKPACEAAASWPAGQAPRFFEIWLESAKVGEGKAFATGYFEPEIAGVRVRQPGYDVPVYALPSDLVRAQPGEAEPNDKGVLPLGRYDAEGKFAPYFDRAGIEDGALMGRKLEIAWAADPAELFFLQVQGSGRLRAPDGTVMRIGYAGQNGHPYTGIGSVMRTRGLLGSGSGLYSGSMQGILKYIADQPEAGKALMRENKSYVFFKETGIDGPFGSLGVAVRARDSVAADPAFVPLGAPVFLTLDRSETNGLWVAQDTGGAIKGANRFDTFWGAGDEARTIAGGMSARGQALLLLPKGTVQRLTAK